MSCRPMGSPRLDKAVGTETAGKPDVDEFTERHANAALSDNQEHVSV